MKRIERDGEIWRERERERAGSVYIDIHEECSQGERERERTKIREICTYVRIYREKRQGER